MELDAVHQRVIMHRPGVCGPAAQRLQVALARKLKVSLGNRTERDQLNGVDLYMRGADLVPTTDEDLGPTP